MATSLLVPDDPAALLMALRRQDFVAFLQKAWPHVTAGELIDWNWHLDAIAYELGRVQDGDSRRLIVNLPPRNGKSKLISVIWVAFMLGVDPSLNFVCVSYSGELSGKLARDCLSVMQAPWYKELFPRTVISKRRSANLDFETTRGGGRLATSVTGTLTGRGGDIIILDDVIKPDEANSETTRNNVNEWFRSTLASRLNDKSSGAILCVMQRLHEFDLCGLLLEAGGWQHLSLPAIAQEAAIIPLTRGRFYERLEGEILHPSRENETVLNELKASMGSGAFAAQYQQDPSPAQGNLFQTEWLKYFGSEFDRKGYGETIQSWDTAIKTGDSHDYSVCITAIIRGSDIFVIDVWRGKLEFPDLKRKAVEQCDQFNADTILIEDKASGQQLIQALRAEDKYHVPRPIGISPESDKMNRAAGVTNMVEAGQMHLPEEASWLADFKSELLAFPNSRHDDQVDAFSQLFGWARKKIANREPLGSPPEVPDPYDPEYGYDYDDGDGDPWLNRGLDEGDEYC